MIEHNAFCNSEPQEDALCGCVDNYDLTDWNDIEPPDWEGGDAPHQRSCLCNGENGDAYDNRDPDGCRNCCAKKVKSVEQVSVSDKSLLFPNCGRSESSCGITLISWMCRRMRMVWFPLL